MNKSHTDSFPGAVLAQIAQARAAAQSVPPLWPLSSSVAVNPFLGQAGQTLPETAALLARAAGAPMTLPRDWFLDQVAAGRISHDDLAEALAAAPGLAGIGSVDALLAAAAQPGPEVQALPTIADLAAQVSGIDWPGIVADRIGAWSASYFDEGQALWPVSREKGAYGAWCAYASHDLIPEINGLSGFAARVTSLPPNPWVAVGQACQRIGMSETGAESLFHRLLMTLGGWAQLARTDLWRAELDGRTDSTLTDLLAIRLIWEEALFDQYREALAPLWSDVLAQYAEPVVPTTDQQIDAILQEAAERAEQRRLIAALHIDGPAAVQGRPAIQAAFCIDVRSEVFRRALEAQAAEVQTFGFAGFFGLPVSHRRPGSDVAEARGPVLLTMGPDTSARETSPGAEETARVLARAHRAWGRFKLAAVSSFAFVEATGPVYAAKLLRDSLGKSKTEQVADPAPVFDPPLDPAVRLQMAETILRAMSLTGPFARLVLLVGHGARLANNPHASALQCGACGGQSGDVNARLLASLLNDAAVRTGLAARGIDIPPDTLFLGALHDTTADTVVIFDADHPAPAHLSDLHRAQDWLGAAGRAARAERGLSLPRAAGGEKVARRGSDWSEVRPEWGLAGCSAFIVAPRHRTCGRNLAGRAFLHSYDWRQDDEFKVLTLILTAPVVVASWISLQYYGSSVAPAVFGAGNKLLHNVTGGIGVVEGNGGTLRGGLPWQSVHDGNRLHHDPLRLSVVVEAPQDAINKVLAAHDHVRALFDNRWLHLLTLDDAGRVSGRYAGGLRWSAVTTSAKGAID
jgi:uncharacterized protein